MPAPVGPAFARQIRDALENLIGVLRQKSADRLYLPANVVAGLLVFVGLWIVWQDATEKGIDESIFSYGLWATLPVVVLAAVYKFPARYVQIWNELRRLEPRLMLVNFCAAVVAIMLFDAVVVRRMVFAVVMAPTAWAVLRLLFDALCARRDFHEKLTIGFVTLTLAATVLPGFYFPPFYDGICGWVSNPNRTAPVRLGGLKLIRDDGKSIWFSHGFINAANFMWRQDQHARNIGIDRFAELLDYYFTLYRNRYDLVSDGKFPNQAFLGGFGYPGHNPYRMLPYKSFPPERIVEIVKLNEFYERGTDRLLKRRVSLVYDVRSKTMTKKSNYLVEPTK